MNLCENQGITVTSGDATSWTCIPMIPHEMFSRLFSRPIFASKKRKYQGLINGGLFSHCFPDKEKALAEISVSA